MAFLESLHQQDLSSCEHQCIVVDSGSTDGTCEAINTEFPNVRLILGSQNEWWAGANNLGLTNHILPQANNDDYVLIINDDTYLENPNYIINLYHAALAHPGKIIGGTYWDTQDEINVATGGNINWIRIDHYFKNIKSHDLSGKDLTYIDAIEGRCLMIPVSVFKTAGLFRASIFPQGHADLDFTFRAKQKGVNLLVIHIPGLISNNKIPQLRLEQRLFSRRGYYSIPDVLKVCLYMCPIIFKLPFIGAQLIYALKRGLRVFISARTIKNSSI